MDKYTIVKTIGKGAFGEVYRGVNTHTGATVAIKKLLRKHESWKTCLKLPELKALQRLRHHPNIVRVHEMVLEQQQLHFVFEFLDCDLHAASTSRQLAYVDIRCVSRQILRGIDYMHKSGFFHRDLKPENVLCSFLPPSSAAASAAAAGAAAGGAASAALAVAASHHHQNHPTMMRVKLTDFGITREIRSMPPFTPYVSTRWYRAPELALRAASYNSPVDVWAVACVVAELFLKQPLFPGSSVYDQALQVLSVAGCPSADSWPEGARLIGAVGGTLTRLPVDVAAHNQGAAQVRVCVRASLTLLRAHARVSARGAFGVDM
jgi:protein kinase